MMLISVLPELAYTPMMNSEKFAIDESYRNKEFQTTSSDRPLVVHFSANNPQTLLTAAKFIEDQCDAIDLNLGILLPTNRKCLSINILASLSVRLSSTNCSFWSLWIVFTRR